MLITHADGNRGGVVFTGVSLSVCLVCLIICTVYQNTLQVGSPNSNSFY